MKYWARGFFAILICATLISCSTTSLEATSSILAATATSQLISSPTSIVQTATASVLKAPTLTQTREQTPTSVETLTENEQAQAEAEIKQLFQNSDICSPPCYLGVVPGETSSTALRDVFAKWGIELHVSTQDVPSFYVNQYFKSGYNLNASFHMKDDVVESISFIVNQNESHEWSAYSPVALLERYGVPSNVSFWIGTIHEPSSTPLKAWYYMIMSYDELDLFIEYGDVEITLGEKALVCPQKDEYGGGRVWLGKYPPSHETYIEEAASITAQKFHDYVLTGPGACFYLDLRKVAFL